MSCVCGSETGFVARCEGAEGVFVCEGGSGGRLEGQHYHHVMEDQRDGACSTHGILLWSANLKVRKHLEDASVKGEVTTKRIVIE